MAAETADGSAGSGGGRYAGLTHSVFGSGKPFMERSVTPGKKGKGGNASSSSAQAGVSRSTSGTSQPTPAAGAGGSGSGAPAAGGRGKSRSGRGRRKPRRGGRSNASANTNAANATAGSGGGGGAPSASPTSGSTADMSGQAAGASSPTSPAGGGGISPRASSRRIGTGATASARPRQTIAHTPQPTEEGELPDALIGFGDDLRMELALGVPTMEGYLIKLGGTSLGLKMLKRWTRRYFVLSGPILRYWETKADRDNGGLGSVRASYELDGAKVESVRVPDAPYPYAVELVTASGLREYLVAEKQAHVDLWAKALQGVVSTLDVFPALHLASGKARGTVTTPPLPPTTPAQPPKGLLAGAPQPAAPSQRQSVASAPRAVPAQAPGTPQPSAVHSASVYSPPADRTRAASVASGGDMSYISSPGVHTVAVAVPVAVEPSPGAAQRPAGVGAGVAGAAGHTPSPAHPTPAVVVEEHTCSKCHNTLEEDDVFCDNCGNRVKP